MEFKLLLIVRLFSKPRVTTVPFITKKCAAPTVGPLGGCPMEMMPFISKLIADNIHDTSIGDDAYVLCPMFSNVRAERIISVSNNEIGKFQVGMTGSSLYDEMPNDTLHRELGEKLGISYDRTKLNFPNEWKTDGDDKIADNCFLSLFTLIRRSKNKQRYALRF
jgi:hypothetical protein